MMSSSGLKSGVSARSNLLSGDQVSENDSSSMEPPLEDGGVSAGLDQSEMVSQKFSISARSMPVPSRSLKSSDLILSLLMSLQEGALLLLGVFRSMQSTPL